MSKLIKLKYFFVKLERKGSKETEGLQGKDEQDLPCGPGISVL